LREPAQERVELGALALVERSEEIVFEPARKGSQLRERALAVGGELDDVPATVVRVAAALDEAAVLELVQQADELAAVVSERVRDCALRLARPFVEDGEDAVVVGAEPRLLVRPQRRLLEREPEAAPQARARGGQ